MPRLRRLAQLFFQLGLAFVQRLQAQLPAMELNAELIDVTGYFGALRFVLFQLALQIRKLLRRCRGRARQCRWNKRRFSATLAVQSHSGGRRVDHERTGAVLALEEDVPCFVSCLRTNRIHHSMTSRAYTKQGDELTHRSTSERKFRVNLA